MTINDRDRCRLGHLLTSEDTAAFGSPRLRCDLETTLEEATTIPADFTPRDLVTMKGRIFPSIVSPEKLRFNVWKVTWFSNLVLSGAISWRGNCYTWKAISRIRYTPWKTRQCS